MVVRVNCIEEPREESLRFLIFAGVLYSIGGVLKNSPIHMTSHTRVNKSGVRFVDARGDATSDTHIVLECPLAIRFTPHTGVNACELLTLRYRVLERAALFVHHTILFPLWSRGRDVRVRRQLLSHWIASSHWIPHRLT